MGKMQKAKELWKDRNNQMNYVKWLGHYSKPFIGRITFVMLITMMTSVITLAMAIVSKKIIDIAGARTKDGLLLMIGIYFGMIVLTEIISIVLTLVQTMLSERFSFGIRKQIYEKILSSKWLDIQAFHTGDLMTRLTSDAGTIADGIINTIPQIISMIVELVLVFFTLFFYSPLLAVFALLIAPVAALTSFWFGRKLKKLQLKVQESEAAYRSYMQESMANLLIVKAFSNEKYASDKLVELRENRFFWVFKKTKYGLISSTAMSFSFQLGYIVAFTYGALQISAGEITYGTMSVFLTLVNRVQAPIMQLAKQVPRVVSVLASTGRVIEIQNIEKEEHLEEHIEAKDIGLKVENVDFGYTDETVLQNVNFDVKPGEMVAIIGESGIGKTTLIRLVMSFLTPQNGSLTFYNKKGETQKSNASCREFISYVPQGNTLFSGTIRENIKMGKTDATDEEITEALKMSASYDFVMNLPQGVDTVIGEKGHGISEGQAQRIAIARALIRKAPFLILDEATSALDEKTEIEVLNGINSSPIKPTSLVITHRMSVLKYCSREVKVVNKNVEE